MGLTPEPEDAGEICAPGSPGVASTPMHSFGLLLPGVRLLLYWLRLYGFEQKKSVLANGSRKIKINNKKE